MDVLILRLAGPMISFGAPIVDNRGVIQDHPTLSMLTGLLGNALGYRHGEFDKLQSLQDRLRFAARCDKPGDQFTDYQTADLGQDFMQNAGWTTRGEREDRRGGSASTSTHLRYRQYLADSAYTVAVSLDPPEPAPDLDDLERALEYPERPLFLGRKTCLPSSRMIAGRVQADSVLNALRRWPLDSDDSDDGSRQAWWPADLGGKDQDRGLTVADQRDWANQVHTGQRRLRHGRIEIEDAGHDE